MQIHTIYGPPGTGKTTELLRILEQELETYEPEEIAYVSFTKEGSEQGKRRAIDSFGYDAERFPHFRTLHSLAFRALKLSRNDVMDKPNYKELSSRIGMRFTGYYTEEFRNDDDQYIFFDELYRNNPTTARLYLDRMDIRKLTYVRKSYAAFKKAKGLVDFTDMIEQFVARGEAAEGVRVAFVDEAQDLTTLQWKMVWTAFKHCDKVYIAGDDDQAIYQWSGADVDYFLNIQGLPTILHHSYRLPDSVLRFAKRISAQISRRIDKKYNGRGEEGDVQFHNVLESVPLNIDKRTMFLTRNHSFMSRIEAHLRNRVAVYTINGNPSVTKDELDAIALYEQVRSSHLMDIQKEIKLRKFLKPKFDLNEPWYNSFKWDPEKVAYMRDVIRTRPDINNRNVRVSTIHASKGAEADEVVLLLDITKNVSVNLSANPDSEHRAFYVGATRAKNRLHVVYANTRNAYPIY